MSESEIDKGSRSLDEIAKALSDSRVGIVCLTPENIDRPWIFFEAGALSKSIDDRTRLCTYLIGDIKPSDIGPPLGMFQGTRSTKEETLKLIQTINRVVGEDDPISDERLRELFDAMWPKLEARLASLPAPEGSGPPKRSPDDIMAEILEIVRGQANHPAMTRLLDQQIPALQQLLPLLQQTLANAAQVVRAGTGTAARAKPLGYPIDTSLARQPGASKSFNTFGFPKELRNAIPTDPRISGRNLDLVQMFGQTNMSPEGRSAMIRFTVEGIELDTNKEASYEINFTLEIETARKIAAYLNQLADHAETM